MVRRSDPPLSRLRSQRRIERPILDDKDEPLSN